MSKVIGYTTGVFDLFHIGHLNLLRNAKSMCDVLIVGVTTDELIQEYKGKCAIIPFDERIEIIRNIKYVDLAIPQTSLNKLEAWKKLKFDMMFVGDDWYGTERWKKIESDMESVGVKVIYFPYTKRVSSTLINNILTRERKTLQED